MTVPTAVRWPLRLRRPIPVYAGDPTRAALRFRHGSAPVDVSSWGVWTATARPDPLSDREIALTVDSSDAANGNIYLVLDEATSGELRGATAPWVFDAATSQPTPRTRVRGSIAAETDVDR